MNIPSTGGRKGAGVGHRPYTAAGGLRHRKYQKGQSRGTEQALPLLGYVAALLLQLLLRDAQQPSRVRAVAFQMR
jgi:hypothetical protein